MIYGWQRCHPLFLFIEFFSTMKSGVAPKTKSKVRGDWGRCTNKRKWHREYFVLTDALLAKIIPNSG